MTRKVFLKSALVTPALPLAFQSPHAGGHAQAASSPLLLENGNHRIEFSPTTGELVSFRAVHARDQEFVPRSAALPAFALQYLDTDHSFRQLTSKDAASISVTTPSTDLIEMVFKRLAGFDLDVTIEVRMTTQAAPSHWSIAVNNRANLLVTDVQFPFIVVSYELGGSAGSEALISPFWLGRLQKAPKPHQLEPDSPHGWQFRPENQVSWHYPGLTMAQFLAYYNDRAGILLRCTDTSGSVKLIKAVHRAPGLRLGVAHVGDWPAHGSRKLEYDVLLQAFEGDWYQAADVYRDWSLQQPWAQVPLARRKDVPEWLIDSPPHVMIRLQGELDEGPCFPNKEFLPYSKLLPLLDPIARKLESPVLPIVMAWERGGPWVYPDCFPPVGGEESLSTFTARARKRGWHIGSYCNGTRWVTQQLWSGYNGDEFFVKNHGENGVCRTADGQLWRELWDIKWRPSLACCLGVQQTHDLAIRFVERLVGYGIDWIQFLDQNVGCSTFPCYSTGHGHPPIPGKWMTAAMQRLLGEFQDIARRTMREHPEHRQIAFSVESTPNEFFMPFFPICDVRVSPPGHKGILESYVPLYHFLHHEFLLLQGGFGFGPEPYHLPIQTAYNFVLGEICGGVLTGDGTLLNKDSINWAPWKPAVGSNEDALEIMRCATISRRATGKPYLVYGRMLIPARKFEVQTARWTFEGNANAIPAVFHAMWRSPEGRVAVALANWTQDEQPVIIEDERLGRHNTLSIVSWTPLTSSWDSKTPLILPPLSCAIVETSEHAYHL